MERAKGNSVGNSKFRVMRGEILPAIGFVWWMDF